MTVSSQEMNWRTLILLCPGFDELFTVTYSKYLREAGVAVFLVGLTKGAVRGATGITIFPDLPLSDVSPTTIDKLLIFPGGNWYVSSLLADPRVHRLMQRVLENNGRFLAAPDAKQSFASANLLTSGTQSSYLFTDSNSSLGNTPVLSQILAVFY